MVEQVITPIAPFDVTRIAWHQAAIRDKSKIILCTGSKGGGKSRLCAEKTHAYLLKYPGAMGCVVRKTRETMTNSTILFMQTKIIGPDPRVRWNGSAHRFEYFNGSFLAFGGMKDEEQRQAVRSIGQDGALDFIWMEEANALTQEDFGELFGCLRGKAAPWQQLIMSTNPDGPDHWIRRMFNLPATIPASRFLHRDIGNVYYSSALDNPFNPPDYHTTVLGLLTGVQYERLVLGKWVQAEGVVYDNFDPDLNVSEVEYMPTEPLLWCCDDGYSEGAGVGSLTHHPRVVIAFQDSPIGGIHVLAEIFETNVSDNKATFNRMLDRCKEYGIDALPERGYHGPGRAAHLSLMELGIMAVDETHQVIDGIRVMRRMVCDANGVRLIQIHPRCANLIREFQMYAYEEVGSLAGGERKPAKKDDHGMDALRYACWHKRYGDE